MLINIKSITIPDCFKQSTPRQKKVIKHYDYYKTHNRLMKKIIVSSNYKLIDGYIDYLIAMENDIPLVECKLANSQYLSEKNRKIIFDALIEKTKGRCSICGRKLHTNKHGDLNNLATIDHIIPLSKGGENEVKNLQIACRRCNIVKSNLLPWEFMNTSYMKEINAKKLRLKEVQANA